jgi:hypothetical protein
LIAPMGRTFEMRSLPAGPKGSPMIAR